MNNNRIIAMIPARIGSTRLKMKNLALLGGKPLISHVIDSAKGSRCFDKICLNSDSVIFAQIAEQNGIDFYHRSSELGSSSTKSDDVVADFVQDNPCDIVVWVNPIAPLQTAEEISAVIEYFLKHELDSLFTVDRKYLHSQYDGNPINYRQDEKFAQTQDLKPVDTFVYSIMAWRTKTFLKEMKQKGHAFFAGKVGLYPVAKESSVIIKTAEDLHMAEALLQAKMHGQCVQYAEVEKLVEG